MAVRRYTATALFEVLEAQERTQAWLARKVGCSESLVSKIKTGERPVPEWFAERASRVLNLPITVLFSVEELATASEPFATASSELEEAA